MTTNDITMQPGAWVEVKSADEIAATLDNNGTLDGVPFMPEMLQYCGRRFRLLRKMQKTCVELLGGNYAIREFINRDVVLLEGLRCSGSHHDGCQRLCMLFWKTAWLSCVAGDRSSHSPPRIYTANLSLVLKSKTAQGRYFCQSTELVRATIPQPLKKLQLLSMCYSDVRSGAVGFLKMLELIVVPLFRKTRDRLIGRPFLVGTLRRTPVGSLDLHAGEFVEIKPLSEMQETLDKQGRNRGLVCDIELKQFCGNRYRVLSRLDRMISEPTGEMRTVEGTVILDGNTCLCARAIGGCPRLEYCYWREVWLRRVDPHRG